MIIVSVFNAIKLAFVTWVLITDENDYIVTLGDAAASSRIDNWILVYIRKRVSFFFIDLGIYCIIPGLTNSLCMRISRAAYPESGDRNYIISHYYWEEQTCLLCAFVSFCRFWSMTFQLTVRIICCIVPANVLFPSLARLEFGAWGTSSDYSLSFRGSVLFNSWIVNLPQVILSLCHLF